MRRGYPNIYVNKHIYIYTHQCIYILYIEINMHSRGVYMIDVHAFSEHIQILDVHTLRLTLIRIKTSAVRRRYKTFKKHLSLSLKAQGVYFSF